jgi:WXG100 family type VII secretion target
MAGEYSVGTVPMATAITNYDNAITENVALRNGVNGHIEMLAGAWTGVAAGKFTGAMQVWSNRYQDAINALQAMHSALTGTQKNYHSTDISQTDISTQVSGANNAMADALMPMPGA